MWPQASEDPVTFHTPPVFEKVGLEPHHHLAEARRQSKTSTDVVSAGIHKAMMRRQAALRCMTAADVEGNKLEKVRSDFPDRFFDTGICESHAVAFAAGMAKAGMRPIVDIYSVTFLQRSFDQTFPGWSRCKIWLVTFTLDRATD